MLNRVLKFCIFKTSIRDSFHQSEFHQSKSRLIYILNYEK
jgi:hypothetical protein